MNDIMAKASSSLKRTAGNAKLAVKKNSPEILLAAGIAAGIATVIFACKETLKAEEIVDKHKKMIDEVHEAAEIAAHPATTLIALQTILVFISFIVSFSFH